MPERRTGLRIGIGGFLHESHSFVPTPTRYTDFLQPAGYPGLVRGPAMLTAIRPGASCAAGALAAMQAAGDEPVPLLWCLATPGGLIEAEAFERIAALLCAAVADTGPAALDGIFLDLHGAGSAIGAPDAEGELLRRLRAIVGRLPIAVTLDPHANVTPLMAEMADMMVPYRTYPHVDMKAMGARAIELLRRRVMRGVPFVRAFRQLDYLIAITSQCTLDGPMAQVMARRAAIEASTGAVELAWCFGFPYVDFPDCGPTITAFAAQQASADQAADALLADLAAREMEFAGAVLSASDAVAAAVAEPSGPVVIADMQDNPGGGSAGDTTGLLAELVRQGADGAVVCSICDPASADACHAAGIGAVLRLSLGGKSDGVPFETEATVLTLQEGAFQLTGPMTAGNIADVGRCALVQVAAGVRVMVASRRIQAYDQAILRHVGVMPAETPILALKSSVHFRADFTDVARRILVAVAPGQVVADPARLPFRHVRPGVRLRPGG